MDAPELPKPACSSPEDLSWHSIALELMADRDTRTAHPLVVFHSIVKETRVGAGLDPAHCRAVFHWPARQAENMRYVAGERIPLEVQFFGTKQTEAEAWRDAFERHFAPSGRGRNFQLVALSEIRTVDAPPPLAVTTESITLDFLTPIPLEFRKNSRTDLDSWGFLQLCATRIEKLFGTTPPLPPPPSIDTSLWRYTRIDHPSRSQPGHTLFINGCVGPLVLAGHHLAEWSAWLALFQRIGLGGRIGYGQGMFRLIDGEHRAAQSQATQTLLAYKNELILRKPLYLTNPGFYLRIEDQNLVVTDNDNETSLPLLRLESLNILSPASVSTAVLSACSDHNIPVVIAPPGKPPFVLAAGSIEARRNRILARHHTRWTELNEEARRSIVAALLKAKIANAATLVRDSYASGDNVLLSELLRAERAIADQPAIDRQRGWEGWAARQYFCWLGQRTSMLGEWSGRKKYGQQPDPLNALLNYAYSLLRHRMSVEVRSAGLDPALGLLHIGTRHESLVSDLMEPFRPDIDRLILRLVGLKIIRPDHLQGKGSETHITNTARRALVEHFVKDLNAPSRAQRPGLAAQIRRQVHTYAAHLLDGEAPWTYRRADRDDVIA